MFAPPLRVPRPLERAATNAYLTSGRPLSMKLGMNSGPPYVPACRMHARDGNRQCTGKSGLTGAHVAVLIADYMLVIVKCRGVGNAFRFCGASIS